MSEDLVFDLKMLYELAEAKAVFGNGEGLAIAGDLELCYWCMGPEPCPKGHWAEVQALLDERLDTELAILGLEFNC